MKEWIMFWASIVAALTGSVAVVMAFVQRRDSRKYAEKALEAQNMGNQLTKAALDEARKSPKQKKADELARLGALPSHAKYLEDHDPRYYEVRLDD